MAVAETVDRNAGELVIDTTSQLAIFVDHDPPRTERFRNIDRSDEFNNAFDLLSNLWQTAPIPWICASNYESGYAFIVLVSLPCYSPFTLELLLDMSQAELEDGIPTQKDNSILLSSIQQANSIRYCPRTNSANTGATRVKKARLESEVNCRRLTSDFTDHDLWGIEHIGADKFLVCIDLE